MIKLCMHTTSTSIGAVDTGHRQGQVSGLIYPVQSQKDNQHHKIDRLRIFCILHRRIFKTFTFFEYFLIVTCPFV